MSSASLPSTIRAILHPNVQSSTLVLTELPIQLPKEGTDEHLVKVYATSPCAGELLWPKYFPHFMQPDRINIPGQDLAGVVVLAPADSPFQPGTEVWTRTPGARTGNAREYSIALTSELAVKPKNLSWEEAAAVPISAFTAYQALFEHGGLKLGWKDETARLENSKKRLIVTAAAGGVGAWVIQLAKAAGVKDIIAVCGPNNTDFVKSLGASEVVNYKEQSLGEWAASANPKADLIIDMVGGQTLTDAWTAVKDGAILLSVNEPPESRKPKENAPENITNYFFVMTSVGKQLDEISDLLAEGQVRPIVDSVWKMDEFEEAFAKVEGGHSRGKVIIKITE